jgi:hypothetical protein
MKREIARHLAECDVCQSVKAEHLKLAGTLQPLPIPSWKCEDIEMDFITGLPKTSQGYVSIWVIVDRLTKLAHFLPVKASYTTMKYAELYLTRMCVSMVFLKSLSPIVALNLLLTFGEAFIIPWELTSPIVPHIILKPVVKLRESIKS